MANELHFESAGYTGSTLYIVVWNDAGQAWNTTGTPAFGTYTTTRDDFDIAATEIVGTGFWQATMPGTAGWRRWAWFLQSGGTPSHTADVKLLEGTGYWDGTRIVERAVDGSGAAIATESTAGTAAASAASADAKLDELEFTGEAAAQVINADIVPARVFKLSSRNDGRLWIKSTVRLQRSEQLPIWIDPREYVGAGSLYSVDNVVSSDAALVVESWGVNRELVVLMLDTSAAVVGTTYTVTCDIHPRLGQKIPAELTITIMGN